MATVQNALTRLTGGFVNFWVNNNILLARPLLKLISNPSPAAALIRSPEEQNTRGELELRSQGLLLLVRDAVD